MFDHPVKKAVDIITGSITSRSFMSEDRFGAHAQRAPSSRIAKKEPSKRIQKGISIYLFFKPIFKFAYSSVCFSKTAPPMQALFIR